MAARATPKPQIRKTIFEGRYLPDLSFYSLLMPAAKALEGYPNWNTSLHQATLYNVETCCSLAIKHDRLAYEQDSSDEDLEVDRTKDALEQLFGALELKGLTRLGYRRRYLVPAPMDFPALVAVLNAKLYGQDERLSRLLPETVEDLMYRLDCADETSRYHLLAGPVRRGEANNYVEFNKLHLTPLDSDRAFRAVLESYPEVAFFLDVDYYRGMGEAPFTSDDAMEFLGTARERVGRLASEMTEYLFTEETD